MKVPKTRAWRRPRRTHAQAGSGIAADARSDERPLAAVIAKGFGRAGVTLRANVLRRLLTAVGPLALTVVGGGAFAKYLEKARWPEIPVSLDDAARATSAQVYDLARYVEQSNPDIVTQVLAALARDPVVAAAVGASVAALMIGTMARKTGSRVKGA